MLRNNVTPSNILVRVSVLLCAIVPIVALAGCEALHRVTHNPSLSATATPALTASAQVGTPTASPVCGGPASMFILLIGSDTRTDNYHAGLSDFIRIVRVDFINPGLTYLAFQQDLYVEIPWISARSGTTHGKLNQAYFYGNPGIGYYDGPGQGPGLLAETLKHNFGVRVDHYLALNHQTFVRVVDTLGGIDIDLPYPIDGGVHGSVDSKRVFPAGPQHLNGYRTMLLARLRSNGDLQRTDVQNLILNALADRILAPSNLPQMPRLIEAFYGSVQTDLEAEDISRLLCLGYLLDAEKITAVDFPSNLFASSNIHDPVLGYTFIWDVDFNLLRAYVQYFNNGSWPQSPLSRP